MKVIVEVHYLVDVESFTSASLEEAKSTVTAHYHPALLEVREDENMLEVAEKEYPLGSKEEVFVQIKRAFLP